MFKQQFRIRIAFFNGSSPTTNGYQNWRYGMDRCKSNGLYLMGKINLTEIVSTCEDFINVPRWIGVIKESYTPYDQGKGNNSKPCLG